MMGSDQTDRPEGLDDVRGCGVPDWVPPFDPPYFWAAGVYCANCDALVGLAGMRCQA
jgi:hypothetical protein